MMVQGTLHDCNLVRHDFVLTVPDMTPCPAYTRHDFGLIASGHVTNCPDNAEHLSVS